MTATIQKTIEHESREANLQAAKQAVRTNRKAFLQRHTDLGADIIDVVRGTDIIERHICRTSEPYTPIRRTRPFCVEELALYQ